MQSTIFFRNFTNLDCAYIDDKGMLHGHSILLSCYMKGQPTDSESVVLDFSTGKKQLKAIIDDKETGLDHKLLIFKDSKYEIEYNEDRVHITTPYLELLLPKNAIQLIDNFGAITNLVNEKINQGEQKYNCRINGSTKGYTDLNAKYFRYSHGLKFSSSWGCQNVCHGHFSFVEVLVPTGNIEVSDNKLADEIAAYLDDAILIYNPNIKSQDNEKITVEYSTERGLFSATYKQPHKVIIFKTETTIEFIIEHIKEVFYNRLKGKLLRISEGLQKGAELYVE